MPKVTLLFGGAGAWEVWLPSPLSALCSIVFPRLKNSPGSEHCLSSGACRENTLL